MSITAHVETRRFLSAEEEDRTIRAFQLGDRRAGQRIIEACLPFVATIALEYRRWGVPLEDIVQEGTIGLLKAAARFDAGKGCRLITYAAYWIRAEIRDFVVRAHRVVRIGASKAERRALRYFRKHRERDPEVLAKASGLTKEKAERLLPLLSGRDASLDDRDDDRDAGRDRLSDASPSPEESYVQADEKARTAAALRDALDALPARERTILTRRYLVAEPMTLEQIGHEFGISKERVRQLEERAKARVKASMVGEAHAA